MQSREYRPSATDLPEASALKLADFSDIRRHHHVRRGAARDFRRLARM